IKTQELAESEAQLRLFMDNALAVIFMKDTNGHYIHVNRLFEELFHIPRAKILGKTDFDVFPHDMASNFIKNDQLVLQSGQPLKIEEEVEQDDGTHRYLT
ncbi:MAG: PAS domain-containing protein, partial [Chlorobium sp.]|nr:PAS domain-containing protein [Chlorobium sp.]